MKKSILIALTVLLFVSCKKGGTGKETAEEEPGKTEEFTLDINSKWLFPDSVLVYQTNKKYTGIIFKDEVSVELLGVKYRPRKQVEYGPIDILSPENDHPIFIYKTAKSKNLSTDELSAFRSNDVIIYQILNTLPENRKVTELSRNPSYNQSTPVPYLILKYDFSQKHFIAKDSYNRSYTEYKLIKQ